MWYAVEAVVLLVIFGFCMAGDSKGQEALLKAYNKGWTQGHAEGIALGGASENRRARLWRSLALDRARKAKQLDESARLLGEAIKTAMRERDEAQARLSASAPVPVPVIGTGETPTGCAPMWVNLEDEGWTWDDLARVLTERYDEPDLSELIRLLVERMPSLSASGQGDTCIGCEHDGEQDKWRPCSSCARNSHDNYESRKS